MIILEELQRLLASSGWTIRSVQRANGVYKDELMQILVDFQDGSPVATVRVINNYSSAQTVDLYDNIVKFKKGEYDDIH